MPHVGFAIKNPHKYKTKTTTAILVSMGMYIP